MGNITVFAGSDDFEVKKQAKKFVDGLIETLPAGADALELIEEGKDLDEWLASMLRTLQTPSFFSAEQVVWVKHFPYLEDFASGRTPLAQSALSYLKEQLSDAQYVVIDGGAFDLRKTANKALKELAEMRVFNSARSSDKNFAAARQEHIRELCRAENKTISADALRYLVESLPADSGVLDQELEKLFTYMGGESNIALKDCQAITARTPEAVSWALTEALASRNAAGALRLLGLLLDNGEVDMRLMAALGGEFQKLAQVKAALKELEIDPRSVTPRTFDAIGSEKRAEFPDNILLGMHPYRAFKSCESAARFSDDEVVAALEAAAKANLALVSGGGDRRMVLEQLILSICSAA